MCSCYTLAKGLVEYMTGGNYIVVSTENSVQIAIRNILNPSGYGFLDRCSDAGSLLRLIRSYHPEFIVVDAGMQISEIMNTLETVDDEVLCAIIVYGDGKDSLLFSMMDKANVISYCPKSMNSELLLHTVSMAVLNYKRVLNLIMKLRQMTENYETRKQVDRAKWLLMEKKCLSENDAYEYIRKRSMAERQSMRTVADLTIYSFKESEKCR